MKQFHLKRTLEFKAYEFLLNNQLTDCILKDGNNIFHAHRLILSQRSEWFKKYFKDHPQNGNDCQVLLPFNNQNVIKNIIDFIYNQVIKVNFGNIMSIIKAADVYGIEDLKKHALSYLKIELTKLTDHSFLKIVKEFVDYDLDNIFIQQADSIERLSSLLLNSDVRQMNNIFNSISPVILARILKTQKFKDPKQKIDRLTMIDNFTNFYIQKKVEQNTSKNKYSILTQEEKSAFENVFTWGENDYIRFLRYKCDWVTDSTSRRNINTVINNRRTMISNLASEITKSSNSKLETCNWYPFVWISAVSNCNLTDSSPHVNIISLLNTLDGFIDNQKAINPGKYNLIKIDSSPELNKHFNRNNAVWLENSSYYLSKTQINESSSVADIQPFYSFNLGECAHFEVSELIIESNIPRCKNGKRQFPDKVKIEGIKCDGQITEPVYDNIKYDAEGKCKTAIHFKSPIAQIKLSMVGEERNGGSLLRIKFIDANGHFIY